MKKWMAERNVRRDEIRIIKDIFKETRYPKNSSNDITHFGEMEKTEII